MTSRPRRPHGSRVSALYAQGSLLPIPTQVVGAAAVRAEATPAAGLGGGWGRARPAVIEQLGSGVYADVAARRHVQDGAAGQITISSGR